MAHNRHRHHLGHGHNHGQQPQPLGIGGMGITLPGSRNPYPSTTTAIARIKVKKEVTVDKPTKDANANADTNINSALVLRLPPKTSKDKKETAIPDGRGGEIVIPGKNGMTMKQKKEFLRKKQLEFDNDLAEEEEKIKERFKKKERKVRRAYSEYQQAIYESESEEDE